MNQQQTSIAEVKKASVRARIGDALRRSRPLVVLISLLLVVVVGIFDYFSGYQIYWSSFYLMAVAFATWNAGGLLGLVIAILSIISWLVGDWAAGAIYPNRFVPIWNALITLSFYLVVIWLLARLKSFYGMLEARIRERTMALQREINAREQLEKEVAEVTERERRSIGHELHDTLCQHLTGTSLSLQVLSGKLEKASLPQAKDADRGVQLVEEAIDLTRKIAKGLFPLELEGEGLAAALQELCRSTADRYRVKCDFRNESEVLQFDSNAAMHLYRIAQEAVTNAIKHGHVSHIVVHLSVEDKRLRLWIDDDGIGLPKKLPDNRGLGLRIMASRAGMIGGTFSATNNPGGGTIVTCDLPLTATSCSS